MKKSYIIGDGAEQGPNVPLITFSEDQVSLDTPNESWEMDGWRLCPLNSPSVRCAESFLHVYTLYSCLDP